MAKRLNSVDSLVLNIMQTQTQKSTDETCTDADIITELEKVDNLDAADRSGMTYLMAAACYGRNEVVRYLLSNGAQVDQRGGRGFTALHLAVQSKSTEIVKTLLGAGADPNSRDDNGCNVLSRCDLATPDEIWRMLIEYGADFDATNNYGISPRMVFSAHDQILKLFD